MITKTPRYKYKIRKLTVGNKTGDSHGLTVPTVVSNSKEFNGVTFYMSVTPTSIIYESGCNLK